MFPGEASIEHRSKGGDIRADLWRVPPSVMAPLFRLDGEAQRHGDWGHGDWGQDDLREILTHQLSAPLLFDQERLSDTERRALEQVQQDRQGRGLPVCRFQDLLLSDQPPLALLKLVKDYAKGGDCERGEAGLPEEVATVLYYAAILVALSRCGQRITALDDRTLVRGGCWVMAQPWVEESVRRVVLDGLVRLAEVTEAADASELSNDEGTRWRIGGLDD